MSAATKQHLDLIDRLRMRVSQLERRNYELKQELEAEKQKKKCQCNPKDKTLWDLFGDEKEKPE